MLARLLRWLILTQVLAGAGLGYALHAYSGAPLWTLLACAVLLPFASMIVVDVITAIQSNAGESAIVWWRALLGENWAGIKIFLLRQPWTQQRPAVLPAIAAPALPGIPVVLVHGYLCNHRIWDDVASHLRANGHTVLAVNLEPLFTSIDRYAPIVESAVAELCQTTGSSKVALVGHSMGGLAIRAWLRTHGTQHVARVVTLGTPHAGTQVKPNGQSTNGRQMEWQSQWLADLAASETDAIRALFRVAITTQDNIVFPQRAQTLRGVNTVVFEGIGHLQMCLDSDVINWLTGQLSGLGVDVQPPQGASA